jgi:xylulokinase
VLTIQEDVEAAMGAALLAAYAVGLANDAQVRKGWVQLVSRATPRPAATAAYRRVFETYVDAYPALKPTMHALRRAASSQERDPST